MKTFRTWSVLKTAVCLLVLLLLASPTSLGSATISKNAQDEIVAKICSLLENNYIFPEIGKRVSEQLLVCSRQGKYFEFERTRDFAAHRDADLKERSNDKHLNIVYDPDWVKQMREMSKEDAYLTEEMIAEERARNFGFKRLEILDGNIGYLDLRIFFHPKYAGATAVAAMNLLSDCEAVIIDLRNNGWGWGDMAAFLCSIS